MLDISATQLAFDQVSMDSTIHARGLANTQPSGGAGDRVGMLASTRLI